MLKINVLQALLRGIIDKNKLKGVFVMWRSRIERCLLKYNPQKYEFMESDGSLEGYLDSLQNSAEKIFSRLQKQLSKKSYAFSSDNHFLFSNTSRSISAQAEDITLDSIIYEIRKN